MIFIFYHFHNFLSYLFLLKYLNLLNLFINEEFYFFFIFKYPARTFLINQSLYGNSFIIKFIIIILIFYAILLAIKFLRFIWWPLNIPLTYFFNFLVLNNIFIEVDLVISNCFVIHHPKHCPILSKNLYPFSPSLYSRLLPFY